VSIIDATAAAAAAAGRCDGAGVTSDWHDDDSSMMTPVSRQTSTSLRILMATD